MIRKVLLIRSSTMLCNKQLGLLRDTADVAVTVLTGMDADTDELMRAGAVSVISLPYDSGFSLWNLCAYIDTMRVETFDEVVCFYNNKTGYGYLNVDLFALATKANTKFAYTYDGAIIPLCPAYISKKAMIHCCGMFWVMVNAVFFMILAGLMLIGMVGVELVLVCERLFRKMIPSR